LNVLKKIAIIDNYDSFTYNLVHLVEKVSNADVDVFLNDKVELSTLAAYDAVILSPGPGLPAAAGIMPAFLQTFASTKKILGVCLGMQAIGERFGMPLRNLNTVMHGIATPVIHSGNDFLFNDIPYNFNAGRYHSWVVDKNQLSNELEVTARDGEGEIMALKHKIYDIRGVQFHPESILSEYGDVLMRNWIEN
jgi:anthranilate synthase component II